MCLFQIDICMSRDEPCASVSSSSCEFGGEVVDVWHSPSVTAILALIIGLEF